MYEYDPSGAFTAALIRVPDSVPFWEVAVNARAAVHMFDMREFSFHGSYILVNVVVYSSH